MGLATVELILAVEDEFEVALADEIAFTTRMGDWHQCVIDALIRSGAAVNEDEVWERLKAIVVREFGISPRKLVPEADIRRDLGID